MIFSRLMVVKVKVAALNQSNNSPNNLQINIPIETQLMIAG
jgi:hypothetical protein